MAALPEGPGFGALVDLGWVTSQPYDDPQHIFN
jgi:hypothetical protein